MTIRFLPATALLALAASSSAFATDYLYVSDSGAGTVTQYTTAGVATGLTISGLVDAGGVAVDSSGDVFVASEQANGYVSEYSGAGAYMGKVATGLNTPTAVALNATGDLFIATYTDNSIVKVTGGIGGTISSFGTTINHPRGLSVDESGQLWVTSYDGSSGGSIYRIDTSGSVIGEFTQGLTTPYGIAVQGGSVYLTESTWPFVSQYNASNAVLGPYANVDDPTGVAVLGSTVYVDSTTDHDVYTFNIATLVDDEPTTLISDLNNSTAITIADVTVSAVPEPRVTALLAGLGIGGLVLVRRRRTALATASA